MNLGMRTGVTGIALFVKGHIHDDFADTIVQFNDSATFFLDVFNMEAVDVCSKFQQWVCNQNQSKLCGFSVPCSWLTSYLHPRFRSA